jgi:glutamate dehydrogenase (NADP+)
MMMMMIYLDCICLLTIPTFVLICKRRFPVFLTDREPIQLHAGETLDSRVEGAVNDVYEEIKSTAKEFNTRGDLNAGANIAAFLRVADVMLSQGSV